MVAPLSSKCNSVKDSTYILVSFRHYTGMEQVTDPPSCKDLSASLFSHYLNTKQTNPEVLEGIGDETLLLVYSAIHDSLSLDDAGLIDRAEMIDKDTPLSNPAAISERDYWLKSLLDMRDVRTAKYIREGTKTREEAEDCAMWELRQDVAARIFRLLYLERVPAQDIPARRHDPELLKATNLARVATRLVWAGFH